MIAYVQANLAPFKARVDEAERVALTTMEASGYEPVQAEVAMLRLLIREYEGLRDEAMVNRGQYHQGLLSGAALILKPLMIHWLAAR